MKNNFFPKRTEQQEMADAKRRLVEIAYQMQALYDEEFIVKKRIAELEKKKVEK